MSHLLAGISIGSFIGAAWTLILACIGFGAVIFVHELGHFMVAKWCGVRVEKFAVGFFREIFGFTRGETRYSFNILPLGGYVKMLGQEDFDIDKSGELYVKDNPRSFTNKPVGQRMLIVSAGVVMNVIFAGLLFMIVYMVGMQGTSTEVGYAQPNWPAAEAGIQPGDVIERIDGREIVEFSDLRYAVMLSEPLEPCDFQVRRQGEIKHLKMTPLNNRNLGLLQIGVEPAVTRKIGKVGMGFDPDCESLLRVNDVIVELNGLPVTDENANEMMYKLRYTPAEVTRAVVERKVPDAPEAEARRVEVKLPVQFRIYPSDRKDKEALYANILGLTPLTQIASVDNDGRAYLGGLKTGDVVLKWGSRWYPTYGDISKSIEENGEIDIPIIVERNGKQARLTVRPKVKTRPLGLGKSGKPKIGAQLDIYAGELVRIGAVADTIDGKPSPAAQAGIQQGALITEVDGRPVHTWLELIDLFRENAGSAVTLGYQLRGKGFTCEFEVPPTIRTLLELPPHAQITAIDGEENISIDINGRQRTIAVSTPFGLREILKTKIGQTVTVTYAKSPFEQSRTTELLISENMIDPWLGRILYGVDVTLLPATKLIQKGPLGAIKLGAKKTVYFIVSVYTMMERMIFSRSLGVENLSGPVGIAKIAWNFAERGFVDLLYFLAIISANLAVLNFLPLPIVDGGLMIFLIIEKIKGSPVNLKIQMATQVIGLILIGAAFVFVTIQDLTR
ncbi:MAG: RIP metalloprotease RseP [Phycisphaerae bacterium]|nr:RIP metalloprotease RseP [Phycisphaerae bacterium]